MCQEQMVFECQPLSLKCRGPCHRRRYCVGGVDDEPVQLPHSCMQSAHGSLACCQQPHGAKEAAHFVLDHGL